MLTRVLACSALLWPALAWGQGEAVSAPPDPAATAATPLRTSLETVWSPAPQGGQYRETLVHVEAPAGGALVEWVFSSDGGTLRHAWMRHERYTREEPPEGSGPSIARISIPPEKLAPGPLDLVTTWSAAWLPLHVIWNDLDVKGDVVRVVRRSKRGTLRAGRLEAPDAADATLDVHRGVLPGDVVTFEAPAAHAGKPLSVRSVEASGALLLEVAEGASPLPDAEGVAYTVARTGSWRKLFEADPAFTLVAGASELPLTWVWPDPAVDKATFFLEKTFTHPGTAYVLDLQIVTHNLGETEVRQQLGLRLGGWHNSLIKPSFLQQPADVLAASCYVSGSQERHEFWSLIEEDLPAFQGDTAWGAIDTRYFMTAALPAAPENYQCTLASYRNSAGEPSGVISTTLWRTQVDLLKPASTGCVPSWGPNPGGALRCDEARQRLGGGEVPDNQLLAGYEKKAATMSGEDLSKLKAAYDALMGRSYRVYRFRAFTGPKDLELLPAVGGQLEESLAFGWFGALSQAMHRLLRWIHGVFGSWAIAIILMTVLFKALLWPLTQRSFKHMQKMQQLKPELDKIKKQTGDDREAFNKEMMALWKRHKVNPLSGCLPMLLQMPIWFALYDMIRNSVELYHTPLGLWVPDLSGPDPYFVMPVLLGILMIVQSIYVGTGAPTTDDNFQAKFMKYGMPVMFTGLMIFLPTGLVLYITVNTVLTIAQNLIIRRQMA